MYLPKGKYCVYPRMAYRLAIVMPPPPPPHFGWPKITFDCICRHFRSICNFYIWSRNGCRQSFWMTENLFRSHFSPFQINTQLLFFFHKMAAGGHFGWPKIAFGRISHHFRSIHNFDFFHKMAAGGHFGWPKITFECIFRHFRSIRNSFFFFFFFHKMAAGGHFGWPKITFECIFRHFRSIGNFFFKFFSKWPVQALACGGGGATKNIIPPKFSNFGDTWGVAISPVPGLRRRGR